MRELSANLGKRTGHGRWAKTRNFVRQFRNISQNCVHAQLNEEQVPA